MSELDAFWNDSEVPRAVTKVNSKQVESSSGPEFPKGFCLPVRPEGTEGYTSEFTPAALLGRFGKTKGGDKVAESTLVGALGILPGIIVGAAGGGIAMGLANLAGAVDLGNWLFAGISGFGVLSGGVGLNIAYWRDVAKSLRFYPRVQQHEREQLANWLAQGGVAASEVTLDELVASVHRGFGGVCFVDEAGVERKFTLNAQKKAWFITDSDAEDSEVRPNTHVVAIPAPRAEVQLPGELGEVQAEVVSLLARLSGFKLDVEQQHVVSRAQRELVQALTLHAQLTQLRRTEAGTLELRALLGDLLAELAALAEEIACQKMSQLQITRGSIRARAVPSSTPRLALTPRPADRVVATLGEVDA